MKYALLSVVTLLAISCVDHNLGCPTNHNLWTNTTTIEVRSGQCVTNSQQNLGIQFKKVVSDSRCPVDMVCIWAGDVNVALEVIKGQKIITSFELSFREKNKNVWIDDRSYNITLLAVKPHPQRSEQIDPGAYIIELSVSPQE